MTNRKDKKRKRREARKSGGLNPQPPQEAIPFHQNPMLQESDSLYDKVLVDAECTHDGSLKHILKYNVWGWENFEKKFMDPARLSSLATLQRGLLANGFRMLKSGGTLVYSTCSFSKAQNEDIVSWFLGQEGSGVKLIPVEKEILPSESCYSQHHKELDDPLRGMVRFDPVLHGTSGLFVAKFQKAEAPSSQTMEDAKSDDEGGEPHKRAKREEPTE